MCHEFSIVIAFKYKTKDFNWPLSQSHANLTGMFVCNVCGKEYKYKTGLWRHKKFECGQEPKYQCPQCPYKTKHNSSLKTHMAIKHSYS
ncbi:hypothetical protein M8J77_003799 [Diaphorina citri]|nr:hypothetical protein M8J77_003799 [Diaphorina citri]